MKHLVTFFKEPSLPTYLEYKVDWPLIENLASRNHLIAREYSHPDESHENGRIAEFSKKLPELFQSFDQGD
jgi:hypothetical protein